MRLRITKRSIEAIKPGTKDQHIWDKELHGFGCRITPTGRRVYVVYAMRNRKRVFVRLGEHGAITASQARQMAADTLARIARGEDPATERRDAMRQAAEDSAKPKPERPPTIADLGARFLWEHCLAHNKPRTVEAYRDSLRRHVVPLLGAVPIAELSEDDVDRLHTSLRSVPYAANRAVAVLKRMLTIAARWGLRPRGTNPCSGLTMYREESRERYLSEEELARLAETLEKDARSGNESPATIAALRLLLYTGCRKGEILRLRWKHVDFERRCLNLADSKTGKKSVYLAEPALELLRDLRATRSISGWVIPGTKHGQHLSTLAAQWRRICKRAGLENVRIHDLRHSFASMAVGAGVSLPLIGALLGHKDAQTTLRYAHAAEEAARDANERTAERIRAAMAVRSTGFSVAK